MGVDPQSDPGPSTSAYLSSRWTSRLSHEAPRCESVSRRSTMLDECCASSHAAWTSSTELRSMRGYGTAQRKRPGRLLEGGGGPSPPISNHTLVTGSSPYPSPYPLVDAYACSHSTSTVEPEPSSSARNF
ncbi:MAG: hypothetical protein FRX49_01788 [Trebouxia sp. A1-2]|nr:MAG: hypothetical protein FRX49_01788 [Trebouxia sp. A1-2]